MMLLQTDRISGTLDELCSVCACQKEEITVALEQLNRLKIAMSKCKQDA